jgi:hypothetical protein
MPWQWRRQIRGGPAPRHRPSGEALPDPGATGDTGRPLHTLILSVGHGTWFAAISTSLPALTE